MKQQILITILFGCCFVHAADTIQERSNRGIDPQEELSADSDDPSDPFRTKRQHFHGGHNPIHGLLSSVFNKKLGIIGSLSSISSSSSSSGKHVDPHPDYEYAHSKPIDWFSLKKSIKASLLQAVKAITGGVIALNGQLVKVKGHLLVAKGHFLNTKGDQISNFGKHLAIHAFGGPHYGHHADTHEVPLSPGISAPSGFGASGPAATIEPAYAHHQFKEPLVYPAAYYKDVGGYAKRAAPVYYVVEDISPKAQ